jgi:MFS family permease
MLLFTTSFSIIHPTLPLFMAGRFALSESGVGWAMAFMGVFSAAMQGLLVRPLVGRIGESALIRRCSIPFVAGFGLLAISRSLPFLLTALALLAIGFGGTLPSLVSLLSRTAPGALQGESLGVGQSAGALGRILGPLAAGVTWDLLGGTPTYLLAAGIGAVAALWSLTLRQPGSVSARHGAPPPVAGSVDPPGQPVVGGGPA